MTCLRDGELQESLSEPMAGPSRNRVDAHLASCTACQSALHRLAATNAHVDGLLSSLVTEDAAVNADVALARVRHWVVEPSRWFGSQQWWAIGAVACVVVAMLVLWQRRPLVSDHTTTEVTSPVTLASAGDPLPGVKDFLPIGTGGPVQMGIVVRVTLPASAFAAFGVTNSGATQADLLVGDDGFAHAIRLVR